MNVAAPLTSLAAEQPEKMAIRYSKKGFLRQDLTYSGFTFKELEERSRFYGHYLLGQGLKKGDKVLFFVRPCLDFSCLTFSLFRAGLIPIFIDPGMGRKLLLQSIQQIKPQAMIAEPEVFVLKFLYRKYFATLKYTFNVRSLKKKADNSDLTNMPPLMAQVQKHESAAILFTSGGTGVPKGVLYTHHIFNRQREMLREMFQLTSADIDLPGFPLFAFFTITMGMTSVIPLMNPARPAQVRPELVVQNIIDEKATFLAGSPAIWEKVGEYCLHHGITLPSVKYLVMFGAPVSMKLHRLFQQILPQGDTYTPYGATESLPVSCIQGSELLGQLHQKMKSGFGTCVGLPCPQVTIKIAQITDEAISHERDATWLAPGELGEICVLSEVVTPEYVGMPEQTKKAKMTSSQDMLWHRMGDLGIIDEQGRLWFCGRKSHRLELNQQIVPTIPLENIVNECQGVKRSALVGVHKNGEMHACLVIQREDGTTPTGYQKEKADEDILKTIEPYKAVDINSIYYHKSFPVDVRHNIKIDRLELSHQLEKR